MKHSMKDKIINALESKKYSQCRYTLRKTFKQEDQEDEERFCILGVICDLYQKENPSLSRWVIEDESQAIKNWTFQTRAEESETWSHNHYSSLPFQVANWADMDTRGLIKKVYPPKQQYLNKCHSLVELNDSSYSFSEIAAIIDNDELYDS